jgi:hypothetical protein
MAFTQKRTTIFFDDWKDLKTAMRDFDIVVPIKESEKANSLFGNVRLVSKQDTKDKKRAFDFVFPIPQELELKEYNFGEKNPRCSWDLEMMDETQGDIYDRWVNQLSFLQDTIKMEFDKFNASRTAFKDWSIDLVDLKKKKSLEFSLVKPDQWKSSTVEDLNGLRGDVYAMVGVKCIWTILNEEKKKMVLGLCFELRPTVYTIPKRAVKRVSFSEDAGADSTDASKKVCTGEVDLS